MKKGSLEMLVLALLEDGPRHGYEIGKLIEQRSERAIRFHIASLYPALYGLERRRLVQGSWGTTAGGRRRRSYRLTPPGRRVLAEQRTRWRAFSTAINRIVKVRYA
ncbi:MAG TPA: PadR family transcriptional regulator [Candidatus Acidoferrales bacterium]|nr:PadR family transcriptional regulator [Candidatus Acidoferrales bacterium]